MKNNFILYILLIFCCLSCVDEAGVAPSITVDSIYVNNERWDITDADTITQESIVKVFATLIDNDGSGLVSFNVKSLWEEMPLPPSYVDNINQVAPSNNDTEENVTLAEIVEIEEEDISIAMSDSANLRFKDNVSKTKVTIETAFTSPVNKRGELILQMYLNIKDTGISKDLVFKVVD